MDNDNKEGSGNGGVNEEKETDKKSVRFIVDDNVPLSKLIPEIHTDALHAKDATIVEKDTAGSDEKMEDTCLRSDREKVKSSEVLGGSGKVDNPTANRGKDMEDPDEQTGGSPTRGEEDHDVGVHTSNGSVPAVVGELPDTTRCTIVSSGVIKEMPTDDNMEVGKSGCDTHGDKMDIDEEKGEDAFAAFNLKPETVKKRKRKQIRIIISSKSSNACRVPKEPVSRLASFPAKDQFVIPIPSVAATEFDLLFDSSEVERELEDSLKFFEQPHEDQDPVNVQFRETERKNDIAAALLKLEAEEEAGRKEIEIVVSQQLKEKQVSTEKSVEKYKLKTAAEEKKEMARRQQMYEEKVKNNQAKIDQGLLLLRKRHAAENQTLLQQHRNQLQLHQISQEQANAEWQQVSKRLRAKHQRQVAEFSSKGEEIKQKCDTDFQRDSAKLRKQYEKRLQEIDANRQSHYSRIHTGFQQLRQRYLNRHAQAFAQRKEELLQKSLNKTEVKAKGQQSQDSVRSDLQEKEELRSPSPVKTPASWLESSMRTLTGAAARHKHRKGVLSQINRQLSVELHNEGIWIAHLKTEDEENTKKKEASEAASSNTDNEYFIPWGAKARRVLESIICGEIPDDCYIEKFDFGESMSLNGGHLRCVMTDLRASDETAAAQRAEAVCQLELKDVAKTETRMKEIQLSISSAQKSVDQISISLKELELKLTENLKDVEKTKGNFQMFRKKFATYFNTDGKIMSSVSPSDTQKLNQALMKYRSALETGQKRDRAIREKIVEAKGIIQKKQSQVGQAQRTVQAITIEVKRKKKLVEEARAGKIDLTKNSSGDRVSNSLDLLNATAALRRDQLNQKRNSSTSSAWIQNLPTVPGPLKRSFWYKMHRRRQQIVLRPTFTSLFCDLRKYVEEKHLSQGVAHETIEDELIRAEQEYLLATHPIAPPGETVSSIPSSSPWAEPGWYLNLEVPKKNRVGTVLPRRDTFPVLETNLSEICSAPGRQAASMIRSAHLRSLEFPLSAISTATSLAESNPSMAILSSETSKACDPFEMTTDGLKEAYSFVVVKPLVAKPVAQRKKSATSKDATPSPVKIAKRKISKAAQSNQAVKTLKAIAAPSIEVRKRKCATQAELAVARAAQRRKTEMAKQQQQQILQQQSPQKPQQQQQQQQYQQQQHNLHHSQQQFPQINDQAFQPRPIMTQPQQHHHQQSLQQQQGNPYNQFLQAVPSPMGTQQRGSFTQFQNTPQMNQFRMLQQQQQQQQQSGQQINYVQHPQGIQQIPQFFPQMGQQYAHQPLAMPGHGAGGPPNALHINMQQQNSNNNSTGNSNNSSNIRQNMPSADDQSDPLFMLKEM